MYMERLKSLIYNTIIPTGYGMSFESPTVDVLDELIAIATKAKGELLTANNTLEDACAGDKLEYLLYKLGKLILHNRSWEDPYFKCWEIKDSMFELTTFSWDDPDTSYEADVNAFYSAAKAHIEDY